jgi:8-oxo-dGTP diphosphatase
MKKIKNYPQKTFEHAVVAVDVVIFSVYNNQLQVLLLELKEDPYKNCWALPGGLLTRGETLDQAALRHLQEKAGAQSLHLEQLYTFGDPNRDERGWVVSVAYLALVPHNLFTPKTISRYAGIAWHPVKSLPSLAYDHKEIIQTAYKRTQSKLEYTNIVYSLVPKEFTLTQLQQLYEVILDTNLDKRNFRKKILSLGLLKKLNRRQEGEANRPAQLYSFVKTSPQFVEIL